MRLLSPFCIIVVLATASQAFAQRAPAIPGVTGQIATEQTKKEEGRVAGKVIVATKDGLQKVFPAGKDPLSDLMVGATVVIHHGPEVTEGKVDKLDRGQSAITVRYANGKTEALTLSKNETTTVVEYTDPVSSKKVARYFTPKS